jgi:hypothetical protein
VEFVSAAFDWVISNVVVASGAVVHAWSTVATLVEPT